MSAAAARPTDQAPPRWDLGPIAPPDGVRPVLDSLLGRCQAFSRSYTGQVGRLDGSGMAALLSDLGGLRSELLWLSSYATLRLASGTAGAAEHDLDAVIQAGLGEVEETLAFFELEWISLDETTTAQIISDPRLESDRHYLHSLRRLAPHVLSPGEEHALACREPAAAEAWVALYEQTLSAVEVPFGGRHRTIDEVVSELRSPDRNVRVGALGALHEALTPCAEVAAHCYDTLVADRLVTDQLRRFSGPRAARDLENELASDAVDLMLGRVEDHHGIARRWLAGKARLLGLEQPTIADEHAPLFDELRLPYPAALRLVLETLEGVAPELAAPARRAVAAQAIDAEPRPGKSANAFCLAPGHGRTPYVLINYTGRVRDALKLAHELGHAVHFQLAAERQTPLSFDTGLVTSEVAALLIELLVWGELRRGSAGDAARQALVEGLEAGFDTVFRQAALTRYEQRAYGLRASGTYLTADRLAEVWLEENTRYYGETLGLPQTYSLDWVRIDHFIRSRFYNYAYAFAYLASLGVLARHRDNRTSLAAHLLGFLRSGGAAAPSDQLSDLGFDPGDSGCWDLAFEELERMLRACQRIAR